MKSKDKLTKDIVIELLDKVGLEVDGEYGFYCHEQETSVDIKLKGNTLEDLLLFIKKYYYNIGYKYGENNGERKKINEIKKALDL